MRTKSYTAAINELGYTPHDTLIQWVREYKGNGDIKIENTCRFEYTNNEKQQSVNHYLDFTK